MNLERSRRGASDQVGLNRLAAKKGDDTSEIARTESIHEPVKPAASAKRLQANRNNAKKCTGPKTPRGISHSRLNALKHGAYATQRLIKGEHTKAYEQLSEQVFAETKPRTAIACVLVDQIVGDIWRLRRVEQAERTYLDQVRASAISRFLRGISAAEAQLVPDVFGETIQSRAGGDDAQAAFVRQKLRSSTQPGKVMLDGMVSADRAFPYSTLEQIRRSLLRNVMRNDFALAELQARRSTIGIGENESI